MDRVVNNQLRFTTYTTFKLVRSPDKNSLSVGSNMGKTQLYVKQKRPQDMSEVFSTL